MCYACDRDTVKWQDVDARINLAKAQANCHKQQPLRAQWPRKGTIEDRHICLLKNTTSLRPTSTWPRVAHPVLRHLGFFRASTCRSSLIRKAWLMSTLQIDKNSFAQRRPPVESLHLLFLGGKKSSLGVFLLSSFLQLQSFLRCPSTEHACLSTPLL